MKRTGNNKIAVVGWGRGMGHQGHMYLADAVITQAINMKADPYFFVSKTVGKDDPIFPEEKVRIYQKVFPQYANIFEPQGNLNQALQDLAGMGYQGVVVVVGADQKQAFQYLEKPNKEGVPVYQSMGLKKLKVISRQETNSKFANEEGPRATPMREILLDPNASEEDKFKVWRRDMPEQLSDRDVLDVMNKAESRLIHSNAPKQDKIKAMSQKAAKLKEAILSFKVKKPTDQEPEQTTEPMGYKHLFKQPGEEPKPAEKYYHGWEEYDKEKNPELNEFAPDEGGGSRKFIPWPEFIDAVKQIVGKDFAVTEKVIKSTIQDRFIPHDPMEYGPTMLYSYYEARAGRNKGAMSTRGSIQVGKYYPNNTALGKQNFITSFNLLKGHPFERHFDLTFDNIYKIANIIMGNTEGAYQVQPQQGVAEGFNSKQEVINHFVKQGKPAAAGAAAWERGWRGSKAKTSNTQRPRVSSAQQKYWWQEKDLNEFAPSPGYDGGGDDGEKGDWNSFITTLSAELKKAGFNTSKDPAHNTPTGRLFFYVVKPPHDWYVAVVMQSTSNPGKVYYKVSRSSTMLKPGEDELIDHGTCPMTQAGAAWIQPRIEKAVGLDQGLKEFAPDGFDGGGFEPFDPEMAQYFYEQGRIKGNSVPDDVDVNFVLKNSHIEDQYKKFWLKGWDKGREEKKAFWDKQGLKEFAPDDSDDGEDKVWGIYHPLHKKFMAQKGQRTSFDTQDQAEAWLKSSGRGKQGFITIPMDLDECKLNEFAPGNGDDDGDSDLQYQVYQCSPENEFDWIGGPLYQNNDLGRAHEFAYFLWKKYPDKAFMIYQPSNEFSRGGYGIPGTSDPDEVNEVSDKTLVSYLTKVDADSRKHKMDPTKRSDKKASKSVSGFSKAFNKLDSRKPDGTIQEDYLDE